MLIGTAFTGGPLKVKTEQILSSIQSEEAMVSLARVTDFASTLNYRLPVVREINLRYGRDDISNSRQQFAANFDFNGIRVIQANQSMKRVQKNLFDAQYNQLLARLLYERYNNISDAFFAQKSIKDQKELDALLSQKSVFLKKSLQSGLPIKVKDIVDTENDIQDLRVEMKNTGGILDVSLLNIKKYLGTEKPLLVEFGDYISVDKIESMLASIEKKENIQTADMKIKQARIDLAITELRADKAAFNQVFDGFQVVYDHRPSSDNAWSQNYSYRFGFNIPLKGNFRPKENKLLLELKQAENEFELENYSNQKTVKEYLGKTESLIKQYRLAVEGLENGLANTLLNADNVSLDPSDIIDLKIIQQKKQLEVLKLEYELNKSYIELLHVSGTIASIPKKNYLSNELERW